MVEWVFSMSMIDAPTLSLMSLYTALLRHLGFDLAAMLALGVLLALGMKERRRRHIHKHGGARDGAHRHEHRPLPRGRAVAIGMLGMSLGATALSHIKVFDCLVKYPQWDWSHRMTLAVIFGILALPMAFIIARWRRVSWWLLVLGIIAWAPLLTQGVLMALEEPVIMERVELMRSAREIRRAVDKLDPGALARAIERLKLPSDTADFDRLVMPSLLVMAGHKHPDVARAAAEKLEMRGDPKAISTLLDARGQAPPRAWNAIDHALNVLSKTPGSARVLVSIVSDSSSSSRKEALELLIERHPEAAMRLIPNIIRAGDDAGRDIITRFMLEGKLGAVQDLVAPMVESLSSGDAGERARALDSLIEVSDIPGVKEKIPPQPLIKILENDPPPQRRAAAALLAQLGGKVAVPALAKAAASSDPEMVKISLNALLDLGGAKSSEAFSAHLKDDDAAMRALAFRGLKETLPRNLPLDNPMVREIQEAARKERDQPARRFAAVLLAWLDLEEAFDYADTLVLVGNPTSDDRLAVIRAFRLLGEARALPRLMEFTRNGDPQVRKEAVEALGEIADQSAIGALNRLKNDEDESVREAVQKAIREINRKPVSSPVAPVPTPMPDEPTPRAGSTPERPIKPHPGPPPVMPPW